MKKSDLKYAVLSLLLTALEFYSAGIALRWFKDEFLKKT
jgi:hypothetical protein